MKKTNPAKKILKSSCNVTISVSGFTRLTRLALDRYFSTVLTVHLARGLVRGHLAWLIVFLGRFD